MELSIREAAALLGVSARTLRARVARGELPGKKRGSSWVVDRRDLPLNEAQRQRLQARADEVRAAVDAILPSMTATTPDRRTRSILDLDALRGMVVVLGTLRATTAPGATEATRLLSDAIAALAESAFVFDRQHKLAAVAQARVLVGHAAGALVAGGGWPPALEVVSIVQALESSVVPPLAGFARWIASLPGGR